MVFISRRYSLKFFKGCLQQNLLSPLLNTLSHFVFFCHFNTVMLFWLSRTYCECYFFTFLIFTLRDPKNRMESSYSISLNNMVEKLSVYCCTLYKLTWPAASEKNKACSNFYGLQTQIINFAKTLPPPYFLKNPFCDVNLHQSLFLMELVVQKLNSGFNFIFGSSSPCFWGPSTCNTENK